MLYMVGTPKDRFSHDAAQLFQGQATDIQIQAEEIIKLKKQLNQIYVKHTSQPIDTIGRLPRVHSGLEGI